MTAPRLLSGFAAALVAGCATAHLNTQPGSALAVPLDSARTETVAAGVVHRFMYAPAGPWAIHVLDVALGRCNAAVALKGNAGAIGREKTSVLLAKTVKGRTVVGGVNADFFLFTPPGVPSGMLVVDGRMITGPSSQPVLTFDQSGRARVATFAAIGTFSVGNAVHPITGWNRAQRDGVAMFDAAWGNTLDTATGVVEVRVSSAHRVIAVDTGIAGMSVSGDDVVLVAGRGVAPALRERLLRLRPGDRADIHVRLQPFMPHNAVGGRPVLLRDSIRIALDTTSFTTSRHPRTAAGVSRDGRRLMLVVVDGRQPPYSDGMTLAELSNLMLSLGAYDAINLDGGGSTTMLYADASRGGALRIANRPSDKEGERPVGDALGIVNRCGR